MKVAIIGLNDWAQSAAKYWRDKGDEVTVIEKVVGIVVPDGAYGLVVRSTRIHPRELTTSSPVTTDVREFFQRCPARIIGVTGSSGKTQTTRLIARMLEEAGKRVWRGDGGDANLLDLLRKVKAGDLVVLALSSMQLIDLNVSPRYAVCLRVIPGEHDFHRNTREYVAAQGNLFWHQQTGDVAIYDQTNDFATQIALLSRGTSVPFLAAPGSTVHGDEIGIGDVVIGKMDEFGLLDQESVENACAAVTVATMVLGSRAEPIRRALRAKRNEPKE
jgi:UDP-N-acetylmuramoylalanine-D-glutamate ligase